MGMREMGQRGGGDRRMRNYNSLWERERWDTGAGDRRMRNYNSLWEIER